MRMTKILIVSTLAALAPAALAQDAAPAAQPAAPAQAAPAAAAMEYCVFRTTKGDIVIELDRAKAPISVENFIGYIKDGHYDGTVFHRVIPGFVIQGGGFDTAAVQKKTKAPIKNEWQNGLKNKRGTLSMARTNVPDSATSQFFVNLVDNVPLDTPRGGAAYAVFGKVVSGMDVVDSIAAVKTGVMNGMRDWPADNIVVTKAEMLTKDAADKMVAEKAKAAPASAPATAPAAAPTSPAVPK